MKKDILIKNGMTTLTAKESAGIVGGFSIDSYARCVATTLISGGGGIRTLVLGVGLFGLCRIMGVAVECARS